MPELFRRLARLARAYLSDFAPSSASESSASRADTSRQEGFTSPHGFSAAGSGTETASGLPFSKELATCYRTLDLPFGAPMEQVSKRWKTYLKQCHPDRYASDPAKQADATRLTQELTRAHEKIKAAWAQHQP
jgi:DnaJ-class molecular chaperone